MAEGGEMIDFARIPNETDKERWTPDFAIPPGDGVRRITLVHDHGEKKIYVDGELYLTISKDGEPANA